MMYQWFNLLTVIARSSCVMSGVISNMEREGNHLWSYIIYTRNGHNGREAQDGLPAWDTKVGFLEWKVELPVLPGSAKFDMCPLSGSQVQASGQRFRFPNHHKFNREQTLINQLTITDTRSQIESAFTDVPQMLEVRYNQPSFGFGFCFGFWGDVFGVYGIVYLQSRATSNRFLL